MLLGMTLPRAFAAATRCAARSLRNWLSERSKRCRASTKIELVAQPINDGAKRLRAVCRMHCAAFEAVDVPISSLQIPVVGIRSLHPKGDALMALQFAAYLGHPSQTPIHH